MKQFSGRTRQGVALATVLFLLVILVFLAASLFKLLPSELRWTLKQKLDNEGYYAATSGVRHASAWLSAVATGKLGDHFPSPFDPFSANASSDPYRAIVVADPAAAPYNLGPKSIAPAQENTNDTYFPTNMPALQSQGNRLNLPNGWATEVTIFPDKFTAPHPFTLTHSGNSRPPGYTIVSLAYQDVNGNGKCDFSSGERYAVRVECSIVGGAFSRYAYFIDKWDGTVANEIRMNLPVGNTKPVFGGPFHTNGVPILQVSSPAVFAESVTPGGVQPHFGAELSFAGSPGNPTQSASPNPNFDGIAWRGGNYKGSNAGLIPFRSTASGLTAIESRYNRMFKGGKSAIRPRSRIDLPANTDRVALAAYGYRNSEPRPDFATLPNNELFIRRDSANSRLPLGGVIVTGGTLSTLLDVVDVTGKSVANSDYGSAVPTVGGSMLRVKHDTNVSYIEKTTVPVYSYSTTTVVSDEVVQEPGSPPDFFMDETYVSSTEPIDVRVPIYGPGSVTVREAPGGGPVGGTPLVPPQQIIGYTTQTINSPVYATRQVGMRNVTYTGTHLSTQTTVVGETETEVIRTYNPTDYILEAPESETVLFHASYFSEAADTGATSIAIAQMPVILTQETANVSTAYISYPIPPGKVGLLRHSRITPDSFVIEILDKKPNGSILVEGPVAQLRGWNRGQKTISAQKISGTTITNQKIEITGPLRQFGLTQGELPKSDANSLGLIGSSVVINVPSASVTSQFSYAQNKTMYLYAAILALQGSLESDFSGSPTYYGALEVIGSVVQESVGFLQQNSPPRGWSSAYTYDPFFALASPVAFPLDGTFSLYFFKVDAL